MIAGMGGTLGKLLGVFLVVKLPLKLNWDMAQTKWKSIIDPLLSNPASDVTILQDIELTMGVNVINHTLGQMQQGWYLTDANASAMVYRSAPFNSLTLVLTASADVTVSIAVF